MTEFCIFCSAPYQIHELLDGLLVFLCMHVFYVFLTLTKSGGPEQGKKCQRDRKLLHRKFTGLRNSQRR